jgi:cytochrome c biogenesis factor
MDLEALLVVGLFSLVLGALLYAPARIWAKREARADPRNHPRLGLTRLGWILMLVAILVLICGLLMDQIAPGTKLGKLASTASGRFFYLMAVLLVFWVVETALKRKGIKLFKERVSNPTEKK